MVSGLFVLWTCTEELLWIIIKNAREDDKKFTFGITMGNEKQKIKKLSKDVLIKVGKMTKKLVFCIFFKISGKFNICSIFREFIKFSNF